jgi:hypothetical protein
VFDEELVQVGSQETALHLHGIEGGGFQSAADVFLQLRIRKNCTACTLASGAFSAGY